MPHEITGNISTAPLLKIEKFACTCAAGLSACCKHIVAILLLLNRYNFILFSLPTTYLFP